MRYTPESLPMICSCFILSLDSPRDSQQQYMFGEGCLDSSVKAKAGILATKTPLIMLWTSWILSLVLVARPHEEETALHLTSASILSQHGGGSGQSSYVVPHRYPRDTRGCSFQVGCEVSADSLVNVQIQPVNLKDAKDWSFYQQSENALLQSMPSSLLCLRLPYPPAKT